MPGYGTNGIRIDGGFRIGGTADWRALASGQPRVAAPQTLLEAIAKALGLARFRLDHATVRVFAEAERRDTDLFAVMWTGCVWRRITGPAAVAFSPSRAVRAGSGGSGREAAVYFVQTSSILQIESPGVHTLFQIMYEVGIPFPGGAAGRQRGEFRQVAPLRSTVSIRCCTVTAGVVRTPRSDGRLRNPAAAEPQSPMERSDSAVGTTGSIRARRRWRQAPRQGVSQPSPWVRK